MVPVVTFCRVIILYSTLQLLIQYITKRSKEDLGIEPTTFTFYHQGCSRSARPELLWTITESNYITSFCIVLYFLLCVWTHLFHFYYPPKLRNVTSQEQEQFPCVFYVFPLPAECDVAGTMAAIPKGFSLRYYYLQDMTHPSGCFEVLRYYSLQGYSSLRFYILGTATQSSLHFYCNFS